MKMKSTFQGGNN